jgi:hypothetical protein
MPASTSSPTITNRQQEQDEESQNVPTPGCREPRPSGQDANQGHAESDQGQQLRSGELHIRCQASMWRSRLRRGSYFLASERIYPTSPSICSCFRLFL